jgi:hypothetical protein
MPRLGVLICYLLDPVYDAVPEAARRAVLIQLLAWLVPDCVGSITLGNS